VPDVIAQRVGGKHRLAFGQVGEELLTGGGRKLARGERPVPEMA